MSSDSASAWPLPASSLQSCAPALLLDRLTSGELPETDEAALDGSVLFVDIVGFSSLAEELASRGQAGVEELTDLLNAIFGEEIELIWSHGGDVVKFAGDALLAVWPVREGLSVAGAVEQSARCGLALCEAAERMTPFAGDASRQRRISVRVGIGAGRMHTALVGGVFERWEFFVGGEPLAQMARAIGQARPGQVVVSASAWRLLTDVAYGLRLEQGAIALESMKASRSRVAPMRRVQVPEEHIRRFVPAAVLGKLDAGQQDWLAELRPLAVLFLRLDPRVLEEEGRLSRLLCGIQRRLYRFEGSLNKVLMDDKGVVVLAAFGLPPLAHEDDAERAAAAGLELVSYLGDEGLDCSVGIAYGRVFCGMFGSARRREYTIVGKVVNLAARLMQASQGDVLLDRRSASQVTRLFELESLAAMRFKGFEGAEESFRVLRAKRRDPTQRNDSLVVQIIGRRQELARMEGLLSALADGQGGFLVVMGDAGLGKSVLLGRMLEMADERQLACTVGCGDSIERNTPYFAWLPVLEELLGLDPEAPLSQRRELVAQHLAGHPHGADWMPLLSVALPIQLPDNEVTAAMSADVYGDNTRDLLLYLLSSCLEQQPRLIVLDDGHWLDSASWALVAETRRKLAGALLVVASRLEARSRIEDLEIDASTELMELGALCPGDALSLAAARLEVESLPERVERFLLDRAEGHPYYTEELVVALREAGALELEGGRCRLVEGKEDLDALGLPDTVQGLITSRLDRLGAAEQLTAKVASVVGLVFLSRLVGEIHPLEARYAVVSQQLGSLDRNGVTQLLTPEPLAEYQFRHKVVQQAAYQLLALNQRRQLHRALAHYLGAHPMDEPERLLPRLAYHWQMAGDLEQSLNALERAGQYAFDNGVHQEAIGFFSKALDLAEAQPDMEPLRRSRWMRMLGQALVFSGKRGEGLQHFESALRAISMAGPRRKLGILLRMARNVLQLVLHWMSPAWLRRRRGEQQRERLVEASRQEELRSPELYMNSDILGMVAACFASIRHAELAGEYGGAANAYVNVGYILGIARLKGLSGRLLKRGHAGDARSRANVELVRGLLALGEGRAADAIEAAEAAIEIGDLVGDPLAIASSHSLRSNGQELLGLQAESRQTSQDLVAFAGKTGNALHGFWGLIQMAVHDSLEGDPAKAAERVADAHEQMGDMDVMTMVGFLGLLALVDLRAGDLRGARERADEVRHLIAQTGTGIFSHLFGLTGLCEVYLELLESAVAEDSPDRSTLERVVHGSLVGFRSYARTFPVGRTRALRFRGRARLMAGRVAAARRSLRRAADEAAKMDLRPDQARALIELARTHPQDSDERKACKEEAVALFQEMGLRYELERLDRLL